MSDAFALPSCPRSEMAVIGAALWDPTLLGDLRPSWFHDQRHLQLVEIMLAMSATGEPVEGATVAAKVREDLRGLVGACVDECISSANFPYWVETLETKQRLREAWRYHVESRNEIEGIPEGATIADEKQILDRIESRFLAANSNSGGQSGDLGAAELVDAMFTQLETTEKPAAVSTGLPGIDRVLTMRPGELIVVAARPSVGKTSMAVRVLENALMVQRKPCGAVSLEMSAGQIMQRLASGVSGVPYLDFERPDEGQQTVIVDAMGRLKGLPIRVCDRGGITISQIAGLARRWKVRHKIELLVVDYLGLIRPSSKARSRYEDVSEISATCKQLARELGVVFVLLAQLNRVAAEEGEVPRLHHLRDSGSIEQDADAVVLLHQREVIGADRRIDALIEKQRNGPLGKAELLLRGPTMRFESVSPIHPADVPR